jgi:hypothetical protein
MKIALAQKNIAFVDEIPWSRLVYSMYVDGSLYLETHDRHEVIEKWQALEESGRKVTVYKMVECERYYL